MAKWSDAKLNFLSVNISFCKEPTYENNITSNFFTPYPVEWTLKKIVKTAAAQYYKLEDTK